ncbi:unnamed protein product [Cyprideis torosa]|uniref:Uncharacterized protein n=1 Tax=Cyprideis torosa TaxID=163714 RepID=A0A7R8ZJH9_9CRUS|nr:unnamed protein product [Cyprideis torosa]CAG0887014.1 unnamed protein product [Cyprideis torosa]
MDALQGCSHTVPITVMPMKAKYNPSDLFYNCRSFVSPGEFGVLFLTPPSWMYRRNFGSSVDAGSSDEDDNAVSASGLPPTPASAPPMSFSPPATPSGSDGVSSSTSALSASVVEDIYSQGGPPSASGGGGVDSTSDIVSHRSFSSYRDVADESGYDADSSSQAAHPRRDSPSHPPGDSPLVTSSQIPESPFPPPESPNPSTAGSSRPGQSSNDGAEVAASPSLSSGSPPSAIHPRSDESPADSSPPQQARKRRRSSADEGEATAREAVASEAPPLRRRHLCFNCNIAFLSENSLRRHVRVAHPAPDGEEGDQGESASPSEPSSSAELNPPPDQPSVAAGEPSSSSSGSPSHEEHPPDGGNNPPASNNGLQPPNSSTTSSSLHSMHRPYHPHILGNPFLPKVEINPFPCAAMEFLGFNPPPNNPSGASATFLHPPPFALLHHQQPQYNQPIHSQNVPRRRLPYPQQENSSQTTASPSQLRKRLTSGGSRTQRPNPNSANSGILPTILNRAPRMNSSRPGTLPSRQEPTVVVEQRSSHPSEKQHQNNLPSSEATPNLPSSTATPNVPSSAATRNLPSSTATRNLPSSAATPNLPSSAAATPNLPSSAATPNLPSSAATPNVPSSAATPNVPSSAVTPNVPSSAATPNLPSSAATPNSGSASTSTPSRSATASCSGANGVSAHWIASTRNAMEQPLGPSVTVSHSTDTAHCSSVLEMVPQSCGSSLRLNMSAGPKDILLPSAQLIDRPVRRSPVEITDEFNDTVSSDVKLTSAEILDPLVEDVASVSPEPGAQPLVPVINGVLTSGSKKSSESSCSAASPQLHKCDHCGQSFKSIPALKAHMKTHSDVKYDCPICSAVFPTMRDLRHHVPSHKTNDGFYVCFQCGIRRPLYAQIRKHVRAYHSDLSYTCPICHRQFSHRNKLRNHLTSHSHDRQFLCSNCGQQFKRKDKLKEHFAKKHGPKIVSKVKRKQLNPGNNMPFRCDHCNAGFRRRGMLVNHVVQHHPSVPREMFSALATPITKPVTVFPCPHCDRKYQSSSKRKSHCLKAHPGKAVPLGIQRRNPDGNNEKDGEKCFVVMPPEILNGTGTIEKPARCVLCHKEYANKNKLIGHMRKAHKPTEEEGGIWLKTASNGTTKQEASDLGPSATMLFSPHMNPRENNEPNTSIKVETVVLPPGFNHRQHIDLGLKSASNGAAKQEASDLRPSATVLPSPHMSPGENNEPNTSIKVETVVLPPGFSYRRHIDLGPHEKKTKTPEQLSRLSENNGDCDNDGTTASGEKNTPQSEGVFIGPSTSSSGDAAPPSEANSSSFLPQFLCAPETPEVVPHEIDGLLLSPPPVLPPPQARVSAHSLLPSPSPSRDIQSLGPVTMNHHAAGGL